MRFPPPLPPHLLLAFSLAGFSPLCYYHRRDALPFCLSTQALQHRQKKPRGGPCSEGLTESYSLSPSMLIPEREWEGRREDDHGFLFPFCSTGPSKEAPQK